MSTESNMLSLSTKEIEQLGLLPHYDIVHFLQEATFDEFVGLTARIFGTPISLLSLVDAQQTYTQSQHGMPTTLVTGSQPRAETLCSVVVRQNQIVIYHNLAAALSTASDDAAAIRATLATTAQFYVGAPLRTTAQHSIGALCLLDYQPREFSAEEQQMLQYLADLLSQILMARYYCRTNPAGGQARWVRMRTQLRDEIQALGALVRYLLMRYGAVTPVPEEILHLIGRRLNDLRLILQETGGDWVNQGR